MNVPMKWLKDYVNIDVDVTTYCDAMTMSGTKVENFELTGDNISGVVVGKILEIEGHPDADKLVVTKVDIGSEVLQIVTGATNISVGDIIPVATVGAELAEGLKIKKGKLRGVESHGMMCSVEELGLDPADFLDAPEHGIYLFNQAYELGSDVKPIFGLGDAIVEYEVTSNRPDCFSILGIAREAAATFNVPFKAPVVSFTEVEGNIHERASVDVLDADLCPRFMAKVLVDVNIGPSPKWLQDKLRSIGLRPINNLVDITNFVMQEMGQPMHAYDLEELQEGKIIVRRATDGEIMKTLDGEDRILDSSMLVIADKNEPIGVAGVMGGEGSKVKDSTKSILFEAANFDSMSIRKTSKKLGLRTDASSKFEKNLDPNNVELAINRACQLAEMIGAGRVLAGTIDVYKKVREPKTVSYNVDNINRLIGTQISEAQVVDYFKRLEFVVDEAKKEITAPTFRPDIEREADLTEEVARLYGYDKIPVTLATGTPTVGKRTFEQKITDLTKLVMEDCGMNEAMTYSFESPKGFDKLNLEATSTLRQAITIDNPLGEDFSVMRTTTVNGMLQALSNNFAKRNEQVRLYEIGKVYLPKALPLTELPEEATKLTFGMYGACDFYDAKGVLETLIDRLNMDEQISFAPSTALNFLHPGRQAAILRDDVTVGFVGEVHPDVLDNYDIGTKVYLVEIDMAAIVAGASLDHKYTPVPKYPAVNRDIAMLVKDDILVGQILRTIKERGGKVLERCELFDVYKGKQIEEGYKSVAYALSFRAADHTLTDTEIDKAMKKIMSGLEFELAAKLRQ